MVTTETPRRILRQVAQSGWTRLENNRCHDLVNPAIERWHTRRISVLAKTDRKSSEPEKNNAL